jgi:hypothetical protein
MAKAETKTVLLNDSRRFAAVTAITRSFKGHIKTGVSLLPLLPGKLGQLLFSGFLASEEIRFLRPLTLYPSRYTT